MFTKRTTVPKIHKNMYIGSHICLLTWAPRCFTGARRVLSLFKFLILKLSWICPIHFNFHRVLSQNISQDRKSVV